MKTLAEFIGSRVPMTQKAYAEVYGDDMPEANKVFVYGNAYHIEVYKENDYSLVVCRDSYASNRKSFS